MPRSSGSVVVNNVAKGLITEATALTFPENAFTEGYDIVLKLDGSVIRRQGFSEETSFTTSTVTRNSYAISEYLWENVAGEGDLTFVVQQIGPTISFYEVPASGAISDNKKSFSVDLGSFDLSSPNAIGCQFASGGGRLFVFHPTCEAFYVEYDISGDIITTTQISLLIRDFEGVDDSLAVTTRPGTLTDAHEYNLYNQGWADAVYDQGGGGSGDAITVFQAAGVGYPSNADVIFLFKDANGEFDGSQINKKYIGNTPAPKGHFILNPFLTTRSSAHANIGTVTETTAGIARAKTGAFFAGRVWYAGVDALGFNSKVYFSQIIERKEQIAFCYQLNDPTSEITFDLLASDGGVVDIQEAGSILKLFPMQDSLLVFATNGIWRIFGSDQGSFKATDYAISKLSSTGMLTGSSIVNAAGLPMWWNSSSIWVVEQNEVGDFVVKSLTEKTIQSFYDAIPVDSKKYAKGAYNPLTKVVQWVYRTTAAVTVETRYNYNACLSLDLNLAAFYPWTITTSTGDTVNGVFSLANSITSETGKLFYYPTSVNTSGTSYSFTYAQEHDDYEDWGSVDYSSYFITGYSLYGSATKDFQTNFVTVFLNNDDDTSSLFIQGIWDFSVTNDTRFSQFQQCYRYNDGHAVTTRRMKVRGHGKCCQLKFYSEEDKPFTFIGYGLEISGNATV